MTRRQDWAAPLLTLPRARLERVSQPPLHGCSPATGERVEVLHPGPSRQNPREGGLPALSPPESYLIKGAELQDQRA